MLSSGFTGQAFALALLFISSDAYLLGESPNEPDYMRCWKNGNGLDSCPPNDELTLKWGFPFETDEEWYVGEPYKTTLTFDFAPMLKQYVVPTNGVIVVHINIHACRKDVGACVPSVKKNAISVTAQAAQKGNGAVYNGEITLPTEGDWVIIAHGRTWLTDSREWTTGGCEGSANSGEKWKLDAAIGIQRKVVPKPDAKPAYAIYVETGSVILGVLALLFVMREVNKCMAREDAHQLTEVEHLKRQGTMEMVFLTFLVVTDLVDVILTCYSCYTCFKIAKGEVLMLVCFVACTVLEWLVYMFVTKGRFQLLYIAMKKISGERERRSTKLQFHGVVPDKDADGNPLPMMSDEEQTIDERMFYERTNFIAGMGEDFPCICLYIACYVHGYHNYAFFFGGFMSCLSFGYKCCSLEKYTLLNEFKLMFQEKQKMIDNEDKSL